MKVLISKIPKREKNVSFSMPIILNIVAIWLCCVIVSTRPAYSSDYSPQPIAMWSWQGTDGAWCFSLVPDRSTSPYWSEQEILQGPKLQGIAAIEKRILSLKQGTTIVWRDLPPNKTIAYPPQSTSRRIVAFAKKHAVNIELWPTLNE